MRSVKPWLIGGILIGGLLLFLNLQTILLRGVIQGVLRRADQNAAYRTNVSDVSGHLFGTFVLNDVRLIEKSTGKELLWIKKIQMKLDWSAIVTRRLWIRTFSIQMAEGTLQGQGSLQLKMPYETSFTFKTDHFPVHALLKIATSLPPTLELNHSGDWVIHTAASQWSIHTEGWLNQAPLRLNAEKRSDTFQGHLTLRPLSLRRAGLPKWGGQAVAADVEFSGLTQDVRRLNAAGTLSLYPGSARPARSPWAKAVIKLRKGYGPVHVSAELEGFSATLHAVINLPRHEAAGDWHIKEDTLKGLAALMPAFRSASGTLQTQGHFFASPEKWSASATGEGHNLGAKDPLVKKVKLEILASGRGHWPELDMVLKSKELSLQLANEGKAKAALELRFLGTATSPRLTGDLAILDGVYDAGQEKKVKKKKQKEESRSAPPASSPAAKTPSAKPESTAGENSVWGRTRVDVTAHWDRAVWYRDGLTSIETQGDLRVQKAPRTSDLTLVGSIIALQGSYSFYGKEFAIESGQLRFTGKPEINPLLNFEASYKSDPTLIYLNVLGTAKEPVLKLRSIPPLPEQDILSILVFGRPLHDLTARGSSSSSDMTALAGSVLGSYLTKNLRETGMRGLDLDVINLEPTGQGGNRLTVGRYMTRNLFVSYGQTITASNEQGIRANYYLGNHWALEGEAGSPTVNHLDVLFRYPLNARTSRAAGASRQSPFRRALDKPENLPAAGFP